MAGSGLCLWWHAPPSSAARPLWLLGLQRQFFFLRGKTQQQMFMSYVMLIIMDFYVLYVNYNGFVDG